MTSFFHIGYPKAGSTTLQKCLWGKHSEIVNLGLFPTNNMGKDSSIEKKDIKQPIFINSKIREFYNYLILKDSLDFPKEKVKKLYSNICAEYKTSRKKLIFSHEGILSTRFSLPSIEEKLRRLSYIDANLKIILIIRKQDALLKSLYRDHPFDPYLLGYKQKSVNLDEFLKIDLTTKYFSHSSSLNYFMIHSLLVEIFGKKNVLILPLEMLSNETELFSMKISEFCNINKFEIINLLFKKKENVGPGKVQNKLRKIISILHPLKLFMPFWLFTYAKKFIEKISYLIKKYESKEALEFSTTSINYIEEKFRLSNKKLSEIIELDLSKYGYPISNNRKNY